MTDAIKLSIIIPHYQSSVLLDKLLSTIPERPDIEVIVVDDHSPADTPFHLQPKYTYVLFLNNREGVKGAGAARNTGLEHARGKWIIFADADDYFTDILYESVSKYFETNYDIVYFITDSIYLDSGEKADRHEFFNKMIAEYAKNTNPTSELRLRMRTASPCSKLLKKDLINEYSIKFEEVVAANDIMFSAKTGYYAKRIAVDNSVIYIITRSNGTLTVSKKPETHMSRVYELKKYFGFIKSVLSQNEIRKLEIYGTYLLTRSIKYGICVFLSTIRILIQNKIPLINIYRYTPLIIIDRIKLINKEKSYWK